MLHTEYVVDCGCMKKEIRQRKRLDEALCRKRDLEVIDFKMLVSPYNASTSSAETLRWICCESF